MYKLWIVEVTPTLSVLLRKRPVLLRANVVLTKDPHRCATRPLLPAFFSTKFPFVRPFWVPKSALSQMGCFLSKIESVGVGPFSPLPKIDEIISDAAVTGFLISDPPLLK